MKSVHPGQLVCEVITSHRIAIGQVDVDDTNALYHCLEEAGMAVRFVAGRVVLQRGCDLR